MSGDGRDRGILSQADRSYLRGDTDLSSVQSERNTRARIRDRIYEAVFDFEVLLEHLSETDRRLVFEKRFDEIDGVEAHDALVSAAAFLYLATGDTDLSFETIVHEGINLAEGNNERAAIVDLDVTYHSLTVNQLRHKVKRGKPLSLTELAYLRESDEVQLDELAGHFDDVEDVTEIDDGRIQSKITKF